MLQQLNALRESKEKQKLEACAEHYLGCASIHPWQFFLILHRIREEVKKDFRLVYTYLLAFRGFAAFSCEFFCSFLLWITSTFGKFVICSSSSSATLTSIQGDVILPGVSARRKTDSPPVLTSGSTRFICIEISSGFQLPIFLRITKGQSFSDGHDHRHGMCVKLTSKCSFFRNCIFSQGCFH